MVGRVRKRVVVVGRVRKRVIVVGLERGWQW